MKLNSLKIAAFACVPVLLISFQNCSKLGTNGIAVDDQTLSPQSIEVLPPTGSTDPVDNTQPGNSQSDDDISKNPDDDKNVSDDDKSNDDESEDESAKNSNDEQVEDIGDDEVAKAIKICKDQKSLPKASENLDLNYNHEVIKLDTEDVNSLKGNHGAVLLRAVTANNAVDSVKINHSNLILCNYAGIETLSGPHNRIIVVGGKVNSAKLKHTVLILVNATVNKTSGSHSIIKSYSLK